MASRAFFRCRACGEPVVAGAYRCPVCGIDWPTGTPGAPRATFSPADPESARPSPRPEPRADGPPIPALLAEQLENVLGRDLAVTGEEPPRPKAGREPEPVEADTAEETSADPGADRGRGDDGALELVPGGRDEPPEVKPEPRVQADPFPRAVKQGGDLRMSPQRTVSPARAPEPFPIVRVPRRRSTASGLGGTLMFALVLLAGIGGTAWWLDTQGVADLGLRERLGVAQGSSTPRTIRAEEGWVDLARFDQPVVVRADGPYRVRVGREVYTFGAQQQARLNPGSSSVSVRAVRAPTVVSVLPQP